MDYRDSNSIERDRVIHYNRSYLNNHTNYVAPQKNNCSDIKITFKDFLNNTPNIEKLNDEQQQDIYTLYHGRD